MAATVTLRFVRLNTWPAGVRAHVLWNGTRAQNGDGLPPADPDAAVDETTPLTDAPIEVWPVGKAGHGAEPYGRDPYGFPANPLPGFGHGAEQYGIGEHGLYGDYVTYVVPFPLRDGTYKFAIRLESASGDVQTDALRPVTIEVAGNPRPPRNLTFDGYSEGQVRLSWTHSWDHLSE